MTASSDLPAAARGMRDVTASGGGPVSAVVLAGGGSHRMGRPKAFLEVGGKELLQRAIEATRGCPELVLAVDEPGACSAALARYGWVEEAAIGPSVRRFRQGGRRARIVVDPQPGLGPLAGLASGLSAVASPVCWVVSCDLPFLEPALGALLVSLLGEEDAAVPSVGGRLQPLCAVYRRETVGTANELLAGGGRSAHALLDELAVRAVEESEIRAVGDPERLLANVNEPGDLERARRRAGEAS